MFNEIHFEIENRCLLDCKHCSSRDMRINEKCRCGYGLEDIKKMISILKDPIHIYFTGGEPLINHNITKYIKELKEFREGLDIGVFTCGIVNSFGKLRSISSQEARYYKLIGLSNCYISIYDLDSKVHSEITNMNESLKYTLQTIENFKNEGINVKIHLVLNRYNIDKIDEIIQKLAVLGVTEVRILRLVKSGSAIDNWDSIGVSYEYQNKVINNIIKNKDRYNINITISGFPKEVPCRPFSEAYMCQGGTNVLYVELNGDVYPCACTKSNEQFKIAHISEIDLINRYRINCSDYNNDCLNPLKVLK